MFPQNNSNNKASLNENEIKYIIEFEEDEDEEEIRYVIRVVEKSSSLSSTYSLFITSSLLSQINKELKFKFKSEKVLFDVIQYNYNARDSLSSPPISFSCSFSILIINISLFVIFFSILNLNLFN